MAFLTVKFRTDRVSAVTNAEPLDVLALRLQLRRQELLNLEHVLPTQTGGTFTNCLSSCSLQGELH